MPRETDYSTIPLLLSDDCAENELNMELDTFLGQQTLKMDYHSNQRQNGHASSSQNIPALMPETCISMENKGTVKGRLREYFQHNWIVVFLLCLFLAWFLWTAAWEIISLTKCDLPGTVDSEHETSFLCRWLQKHRNEDTDSAPPFDDLSTMPTFFTRNCSGESSTETLPCSRNSLLNLSLQRLHQRVNFRLNQSHLLSTPLELVNTTLFVGHDFLDSGMGLGNQMFMLASIYGIAKTNHRLSVLVHNYPFETYFENLNIRKSTLRDLFPSENPAMMKTAYTVKIQPFATYDPVVTNLTSVKGDNNILLDGYTQAFPNFDLYRSEIRSMFGFRNNVTNCAINAVRNSLQEFFRKTGKMTVLPLLVGVHVRRGDILQERYRTQGHKPATEEYLLRTVLHVQTMHNPVVFVVISNDYAYCRKLFREANFVFVDRQPEEVDLAILTLMDSLILSVGSFGWWGAYLSDAKQVYYYKDWPRNGSDMQHEFTPKDYFLPEWIPAD